MTTSIVEAIEIINKNIESINSYEIVPIESALKRVASENLFATNAIPRFNNSAMDGYGLKFDSNNETLDVIGTIFAGDNKDITVDENSAIKIMTGARVPNSVDVVIPKENLEEIGQNRVKINRSELKINQHIRFKGEDLNLEDSILRIGEKINSGHIAILASQGTSHIKVKKRVKVSIFATGEELKLHYEKIEPHQIYNSNTPTLLARAKELDCDIEFIGVAKDNLETIKSKISDSLNSDLVVTSGGVSVGDADFTKEAFSSFNFTKYFEKLDIKPGKPTVFGKIGKTYILNLPGNPLAAISIFEVFGRLIINNLQGLERKYLSYIPLPLNEPLKQKSGKYSLVVGKIDHNGFTPAVKRAPGMVSVMRNCNGFILTDNNVSYIEKKKIVKVVPIYDNILSENFIDLFSRN